MNYPFELQRREAAAIRVRREKAAPLAVSAKEEGETPPEDTPTGVGLGRLPPRTVGLTLSGGGAVWLEIARRRLPPNLDPSTGETSVDPGTVIRNRLTRGLGEALVLVLLSILWTVVDTVARGFALGKLNSFIATWTILVVLITPFLRRAATFLGASASKKDSRFRHSTLFTSAAFRAGIIGFPIAGLLLVLLDGTVHWLFNQRCAWGCAALLAGAVLSLIFGRAFDFLNFSALQDACGAWISHAFLGASNPARISASASQDGRDVQIVHPDDDIAFEQYHPESYGALFISSAFA